EDLPHAEPLLRRREGREDSHRPRLPRCACASVDPPPWWVVGVRTKSASGGVLATAEAAARPDANVHSVLRSAGRYPRNRGSSVTSLTHRLYDAHLALKLAGVRPTPIPPPATPL